MTVTHVGSSKKYVAGWDKIFGASGQQTGRKQSAKRKSAAKPKRSKKK